MSALPEPRLYDFAERLAFSRTATTETPDELLRRAFVGVVSVDVADIALDKSGVDFVVTLRRGGTIGVDLKAREEGCSRYWNDGPELALETWSVCPSATSAGKAGWTLDEAKATDYTMHTFHSSDSMEAYVLPFQQLRTAFSRNVAEWSRRYRVARQSSGRWQSECVFVPARVVVDELNRAAVIDCGVAR